MQIKVTSWNIWSGKRLPEVLSFLKSEKPDIIGLQEAIKETGKKNTAEIIAQELGYEYVYSPAFLNTRHKITYEQGNAVLSKFTITSNQCHFLTAHDLYQNTAETEPRIAIEALIKIKNVNLKVFCTHLAYSHQLRPSKMRDLQVDNLLKLLPQKKTILLGDFNAESNGNEIKKISHVMKNADFKTPHSPTWTVHPFNYFGFVENDLKHRLDYIFTSNDIRINDFVIGNSQASDHLPVTAVIEL